MKLNDVTWFLGICLSGLYYLFNKMRKNEFYFFLIKRSLYFAVTFTIAFIGLVVSFNGNNHDELTSDYFNTIITTNDDNRNPDLQIQEIKENSDKFYAKDFSLFDYLGCALAISFVFSIAELISFALLLLFSKYNYIGFVLSRTFKNSYDHYIFRSMMNGEPIIVKLREPPCCYLVYPYFVSSTNALFVNDKYLLALIISIGHFDECNNYVVTKDYYKNVIRDLEHLQNLRICFNPQKCSFFKRIKVFFCGNDISNDHTFKVFEKHSKRINFSDIEFIEDMIDFCNF